MYKTLRKMTVGNNFWYIYFFNIVCVCVCVWGGWGGVWVCGGVVFVWVWGCVWGVWVCVGGCVCYKLKNNIKTLVDQAILDLIDENNTLHVLFNIQRVQYYSQLIFDRF